ncbi:hypothetical protein NMG60_11014839 [Bertholletia excelsa]
MAFIPLKALVLLQLSALLLSSLPVLGYDVYGVQAESPHHPPPATPPAQPPKHPKSHSPAQPPHHHHHHNHTHHHAHAPVQSPAQPPSHPPVQPPAHIPVHPPSNGPSPSKPLPKRKLVAVQGVVYCKPCKYVGVDTLLGASPLLGAEVKLQCNNSRYPLVQEAKTDKNGYFFIEAVKRLTTFGTHKCRVFLVSSPAANCSKPTNLNFGEKGAILMPKKPPAHDLSHPLPYELYTVGPFAFEPPTKCYT